MNQVVAGEKGRILVSVFGSLVRTGENTCTRFLQWKKAQQIAQTFKLPWLVLHPYGPTGTAVTQWYNPHTCEYDGLGSLDLGAEIERYQPDYLVCACPDQAPFEGGHWCDRIGKTLILNPGCRPVGDFPCHIELNLERNRARWRVAGIEDAIVSLGEETGSSSENTQSSYP
jgi:Icc-related predicted phosphoesterase